MPAPATEQGKEESAANTPTKASEVVVAFLRLSGVRLGIEILRVEQVSDRAGGMRQASLGSESKGPARLRPKLSLPRPPAGRRFDFQQNLNPAPRPLSGALAKRLYAWALPPVGEKS